MLEFVKKHPYMSAAGIFVVGAILVVLLFSGNDGASSVVAAAPDNSSAVAANTQLAMAQLQGQVDMAGISAGVSVEQGRNAVDMKALELEYARGSKADDLSSAIAMATITSQASTQTLMSTLSAQVANAQIEAQVRGAEIASATATSLATIQANNMEALTNINADSQIKMQQSYADMMASMVYAQNDRELGLATINQDTVLSSQANQLAADSARRTAIQQQVDAINRQINNKSAQAKRIQAGGGSAGSLDNVSRLAAENASLRAQRDSLLSGMAA